MEKIGGAAVAAIGAFVALAIVAVVVSKNAQTPTVLTSAGQALSQVIGAAVSPVTGASSLSSSLGGLSNLFGSTMGNGSASSLMGYGPGASSILGW